MEGSTENQHSLHRRGGTYWTSKFQAFFLLQIIPKFAAFGAESLPSFNDPCGLQPCLADMTEVVNNFGFPAGFDEQLATICRKLSDSLRCIDEKFLGCVSTAAKRRAALELKNAADFLRDLCNDSDFHRDYLRHAQCFNNVTNQNSPSGCWYFTSTIVVHYRKLAETFHSDSVQQWGSHFARNEAAKMYMHAICCAHSEFMPCAYRASYHNCGPHAAQFAFNYMWRMTSPVFQETCHHLKRWRSCDSKASLYRSMLTSGASKPATSPCDFTEVLNDFLRSSGLPVEDLRRCVPFTSMLFFALASSVICHSFTSAIFELTFETTITSSGRSEQNQEELEGVQVMMPEYHFVSPTSPNEEDGNERIYPYFRQPSTYSSAI